MTRSGSGVCIAAFVTKLSEAAVLRRRLVSRLKAIESSCCSGKKVGSLGIGRAFRQQLASIPKHWIAVGTLVDREVAFEHRARRSEGLNAGLDVGAPRIPQ